MPGRAARGDVVLIERAVHDRGWDPGHLMRLPLPLRLLPRARRLGPACGRHAWAAPEHAVHRPISQQTRLRLLGFRHPHLLRSLRQYRPQRNRGQLTPTKRATRPSMTRRWTTGRAICFGPCRDDAQSRRAHPSRRDNTVVGAEALYHLCSSCGSGRALLTALTPHAVFRLIAVTYDTSGSPSGC